MTLATDDIVGEALIRTVQDPGLTPELHALLAEHAVMVPVTRLRADNDGPVASGIVLWKDPSDDTAFVPLFSTAARIPDGCPPTVTFVWDTLKRLTTVLPRAHFRINPAGPVMYDLPSALAHALAHGHSGQGTAPATFPAGGELGLGPPTEDHALLVAALRSYFSRQFASPAVFLYEVHRRRGPETTPALAIGVVSDFDPTIAADIAAIVPEAYVGTLPVDIAFIGGNPEIVDALVHLGLSPTIAARAPRVPQ